MKKIPSTWIVIAVVAILVIIGVIYGFSKKENTSNLDNLGNNNSENIIPSGNLTQTQYVKKIELEEYKRDFFDNNPHYSSLKNVDMLSLLI